jgi:hypothetical protein
MSDRFGSPIRMGMAGVAAFAIALMGSLLAAHSARAFDTSGPLDQVNVNEQLSCQIIRGTGEFVFREFDYNDYDQCGTFVGFEGGSDGLVFGDTNISPADFDYVFDDPNQTFSGNGSPGSPFRLTTVVYVPALAVDETDSVGAGETTPAVAGSTVLRLTQTDTYVNGDEHYRTDIVVDNTFGDNVSATLYHAGDCALKDSDSGYAVADDSGNGPFFCTPPQPLQTSALPPRPVDHAILGFVPIEPDANRREANIDVLWGDVNGLDFNDVSQNYLRNPASEEPVDNGAGLSWPIELDVGESMHVCFLTVDSYAGNVPSIPSGCTPTASPPGTIAQKPSSCKLRISRARIFLFSRHPRMRLVARYRSSDPADVNIDYVAVNNGNKVPLGEVVKHFGKHGLFRLRKELTESQAESLRSTDRFIVHFKIPGEPGFCARQYTKHLTVPRIVEGQRVVFQEDSKFPQPGAGHPEN